MFGSVSQRNPLGVANQNWAPLSSQTNKNLSGGRPTRSAFASFSPPPSLSPLTMARSRKRDSDDITPGPQAENTEAYEELEELEDHDELEELEELDEWSDEESDSSVKLSHEIRPSDECDVRITLVLTDLEKAEVTDAITAPLRRKASQIAADVRWRNIEVVFEGETLIPSAAKAHVAELLAEVNPLSVVVQRGFGGEKVIQNELPTVQWAAKPDASDPSRIHVDVDTGDLETIDLPIALTTTLEAQTTDARDRSFEITFSGRAAPDENAIARIAQHLDGHGASRVAVTEGDSTQLLFDHALERLVVVRSATGDCDTEVELALDGGTESTCEAMAHVLPRERSQLAGQHVRVCAAGRSPEPAEIAALLCHSAGLLPSRLELQHDGSSDLLWPMLLPIPTEDPATVTVDPAGRGRAGLLAALRREAPGLSRTDSLPVTIDWPAGFELDEEIERAFEDALAPFSPKSVSYTFGGQDREPVRPAALTLSRDATGGLIYDLNTDTGKPSDLVRAIERRLPAAMSELAGQQLAINIQGSGAMSRSMRRALHDGLQAVGVAGARLIDHGTAEVLLPHLLASEEDGDSGLRLIVSDAGRDDEDWNRAFEDELPPILEQHRLSEVTLTVVWPGANADDARVNRAIERLIAADPAAVLLRSGDDGPVQLYPEELPEIEEPQPEPATDAIPEGSSASISATAPCVTVLARRDQGTPPMVMIGVDWFDDASAVGSIEAALTSLSVELATKRVLVVFRAEGRDHEGPDAHPLVLAVRTALSGQVAALLEFRGTQPATPAHFQVTHSTLDELPLKMKVSDPRARPAEAFGATLNQNEELPIWLIADVGT